MTKTRQIGFLACLMAAFFFAFELIQLHMMNVLSSDVMHELKLNAAAWGTLTSSYLFADVLFLIPAGIILDRLSVRRVILASVVLCIIGIFGFANAFNLVSASFFHFISGIGNAFCFLSCMTLATKWFEPKRRGFIMALMITVGMLGAALAQWPVSLLMQTFTWRSLLLLDGALGFFLLIGVYLFVHEPLTPASSPIITWKGSFRLFTKALRNPQNMLSGLYISLMNMPLMLLGAVWGNLFLKQIFHFSDQDAAMIIGMIATGTIFGSTFFGWLSERLAEKRFPMRVGAFTSFFLLIAIFLMPQESKVLFAVLYFLLGFFTSTQVLGYPVITENSPQDYPATSLGVGGVLVMGLPMLLYPFTGFLLDLSWDQLLVDGVRLFSLQNFLVAFSIMPIGIFLSFFLTHFIREQKA